MMPKLPRHTLTKNKTAPGLTAKQLEQHRETLDTAHTLNEAARQRNNKLKKK